MHRRGKRWCALIGVAVAVAAAPEPASAAKTAIVGPGGGASVAVDGAGAAHVAWKVEGQDNAVFFCTVPRNASACAGAPVPVPFPEDGFDAGLTTVFLPAPGVVEVVVARDGGTYVSRSTDGGRTFALGFPIFGSISTHADRLPDGRIATTGAAPGVVSAGVARPDGADAETSATELTGDVLSGFFQDVATSGNDVIVSGGQNDTRTFRLPAGANSVDANAWQPLPEQPGGRGRVAGGPAGIFSLVDSEVGGGGKLYAQRLEGAIWGPQVTVLPDDGLLYGTELEQDPGGGLHAFWTDEPDGFSDALLYSASGDGGALWSRGSVLAILDSRLADITADILPNGRGAVVASTISGDDPINLAWIDPRAVPAKYVRIGDSVVQARADCRGTRTVGVRVRASRGGRAVKVGTVLRGASFSARGARRRSASRYAATFRVRRQRTSARVTVRVRPRAAGERSRKLRVRALTCNGRL